MDNRQKRSLIILGLIFLVTPILVAFNYFSAKYDLVIGAKSFAESEILASIAQQTINKHDPSINIGLKKALTSSQINLILNGGQIHGLAEYTGSIQQGYWIDTPSGLNADDVSRWDVKTWSENLDKDSNTSGLWYGTGVDGNPIPGIGFENSYGVIVKPGSAYENVTSFDEIIDLGGNLAVDSTFAAADVGLAAIYDRYMKNPSGTTSGPAGKGRLEELGLEVTLVDSTPNRYDYIRTGVADITVGYTTDAQLADTANYKVLDLQDVKNGFPTYDVAYLFRQDILNKYKSIESKHWNRAVSLKEILNSVSINATEMIAMNNRVQTDNVDPEIVAKEFLETKNYF